MIRINLLPVRQLKKRQRVKAELGVFTSSLLAILALLAVFGFSLAGTITTMKDEIASLENKKKSYEPKLKEIAKLQKDKQLLQAKLDAIKELQSNAQITVRVLDEVASRTPTNRMWLTSLQQSAGKLQLQGVALDNETIAQYMQQLEASQYFKNTDLTSSSQTVVAGQKLKSFSLTVNVIVPNT
ncbi:PilN domain-containing protein [Thiovibrio sp. JS02]